jgi:hypothetical protein
MKMSSVYRRLAVAIVLALAAMSAAAQMPQPFFRRLHNHLA